MSALIWMLNVAIATLAALNAVSWGYSIRDVGDPQLSISFLFRLVFNKWFILAMAPAFLAALLSYIVLKKMEGLNGKVLSNTRGCTMILVCTLILKEKLTAREWVKIATYSS